MYSTTRQASKHARQACKQSRVAHTNTIDSGIMLQSPVPETFNSEAQISLQELKAKTIDTCCKRARRSRSFQRPGEVPLAIVMRALHRVLFLLGVGNALRVESFFPRLAGS